jgi:hypothetical protein
MKPQTGSWPPVFKLGRVDKPAIGMSALANQFVFSSLVGPNYMFAFVNPKNFGVMKVHLYSRYRIQ